jgi:hypothetical protein
MGIEFMLKRIFLPNFKGFILLFFGFQCLRRLLDRLGDVSESKRGRERGIERYIYIEREDY